MSNTTESTPNYKYELPITIAATIVGFIMFIVYNNKGIKQVWIPGAVIFGVGLWHLMDIAERRPSPQKSTE